MQSALTSLICQMKKVKQLVLRPLLVLSKDVLGHGGAKEEEELCLRDDSQSRGPLLPRCRAAFGYSASTSFGLYMLQCDGNVCFIPVSHLPLL